MGVRGPLSHPRGAQCLCTGLRLETTEERALGSGTVCFPEGREGRGEFLKGCRVQFGADWACERSAVGRHPAREGPLYWKCLQQLGDGVLRMPGGDSCTERKTWLDNCPNSFPAPRCKVLELCMKGFRCGMVAPNHSEPLPSRTLPRSPMCCAASKLHLVKSHT